MKDWQFYYIAFLGNIILTNMSKSVWEGGFFLLMSISWLIAFLFDFFKSETQSKQK